MYHVRKNTCDFATSYGVTTAIQQLKVTTWSGPRQELKGCALIRELHVYGTLVAARRDAGKADNDERPQHIGAVDEEREVGDETGYVSILCLCFNELSQKGDDLDV